MASQPKVRQIAAKDLKRHPLAQRGKPNKTLVREIALNLDLGGLGELTASKQKDGQLFLVDGATRHQGVIEAGHPNMRLRVAVYESLTREEEHNLFLKLNRRKNVNSYDKFINGLGAKYPECVGTDRVVRSLGLAISDQKRDGNILCVGTLTDIYEKHGADVLRYAIETPLDAWGPIAGSVEAPIVSGFAQLYGQYNGNIDRKSIAAKMGKFRGGPHGLLGAARSMSDLNGRAVARNVAEAVRERYNAGRRSGALA